MALPWTDNPYGYSTNGNIAQCNLNVAVGCGMSAVRRIISWSNLMPTQGVFDPTALAQLDSEVLLAYTNHINYTLVLDAAPTWANSGGSNPTYHNGCTNFDPSQALIYVQALLNRYNGGGISNALIARLEIGNEGYNDKGTGATCNSFENVVPVLQSVYPWVKTNYPNVLIGMPAHFNRKQSEITRTHQTLYTGFYGSAKGLFDYSNYHWYGAVHSGTNYTGPDGPQSVGNDTFNQEWIDIHSVDVTNGNGSIPIYVTETGIAVPGSNNNTEAQKACFFAGGNCGVGGTPTTGVLQDGYNSGGVLTHIFIWTVQNSDGYSISQGCSNQTLLPAALAITAFSAANPQWPIPSPSSSPTFGGFMAHS